MRADAEVGQDLRPRPVVAGIGGEPELEVGLHRVGAGVLQLVGAQLVQQADPPALVAAEVEHDAASLVSHPLHRGRQLGSAVATRRPEDIAGQALRVHADEHVLTVTELTVDQGHVVGAGDGVAVAVRGEVAEPRGQRASSLPAPPDARSAAHTR